ncbi:MAG: TerB family tellurite resistance protein [Alphaproteobacteria bacterium]|nr:TerB family tellurite resistance protein [Alphaproteobacteria bacterium]
MAQGLRSVVVRPDALTEAQIDQMLVLRLAHVVLADRVSPEADRARFFAKIRSAAHVLLLVDADDAIRGCFVVVMVPVCVDGRTVVVVNPEYLYIEPAFRGHPALGQGIAKTALRLMITARGRPLCFGAICFLPSYLAVCELLPKVVLLGQPGVDASDHALLLAVGTALGGDDFDAERGLVSVTVRPSDLTPRTPRSSTRRSLAAAYEAVNPDWRQGTCGVIVGSVTPRMLVRSLTGAVARRLRGLGDELAARQARAAARLLGDEVDGEAFFGLLAAVAAADGTADQAETTALAQVLRQVGVDERAARPLLRQAHGRHGDPIAALPGPTSRATATIYLQHALAIADSDGRRCGEELALLQRAAARLGHPDLVEVLGSPP